MHPLSYTFVGLIDEINAEFITIEKPGVTTGSRLYSFLHSIILRSLISLSAAHEILSKTDQKPIWRFPYSLILRSVVMDMILGAKVLQTEKNHPEDLEKLLDRIYCEHRLSLYKTRKTSSQLYEGDLKFGELMGKLESEIHSLGLSTSNPISLYEYIRQLHSEYTDELSPHIVELYEHYDLFSKLTHFGEYSMDIMATQAEDPQSKAGDVTIRRNLMLVFDNMISIMKRLHPASNLETSCIAYLDEWIMLDFQQSPN